jgi:hypothetical protein
VNRFPPSPHTHTQCDSEIVAVKCVINFSRAPDLFTSNHPSHSVTGRHKQKNNIKGKMWKERI